MIDATHEKGTDDKVAFSLRIPNELCREVDTRAKAYRRTRTAEIIYLIQVGIQAKKAGFVTDTD